MFEKVNEVLDEEILFARLAQKAGRGKPLSSKEKSFVKNRISGMSLKDFTSFDRTDRIIELSKALDLPSIIIDEFKKEKRCDSTSCEFLWQLGNPNLIEEVIKVLDKDDVSIPHLKQTLAYLQENEKKDKKTKEKNKLTFKDYKNEWITRKRSFLDDLYNNENMWKKLKEIWNDPQMTEKQKLIFFEKVEVVEPFSPIYASSITELRKIIDNSKDDKEEHLYCIPKYCVSKDGLPMKSYYTKKEVIRITDKIQLLLKGIKKPEKGNELQELDTLLRICERISYIRYNFFIVNDIGKKDRVQNVESRDLMGLITGKSVCAGYSEIICELCSQMGIECRIISASEGAHVWNQVKIGGKWLNLDYTWFRSRIAKENVATPDILKVEKDFLRNHPTKKFKRDNEEEKTEVFIDEKVLHEIEQNRRRVYIENRILKEIRDMEISLYNVEAKKDLILENLSNKIKTSGIGKLFSANKNNEKDDIEI